MESDFRHSADVRTTIRDLQQKFNRKLDDHLFIIQQQRDRIDYQQQQIDGQRFLIEELAWQIRDLRDSLRKTDEKLHAALLKTNTIQDKKNCPYGKYCEEATQTNDTNPIQSKYVRDVDAMYFEHPPVPIGQKPIQQQQQQQQKPFDTDQIDNVNKNVERDINNCLHDCIPPPPATSPPKCDSDTDTDSVQIRTETFDKLNELYEMSHFVRHSKIELDDLDEIVYRYKERRDFASGTERGSSKSVWSLNPDYTVEYLPRVSEESSEANSITSNEQNAMPNKFPGQKCSEEVFI